MSNYLCICGHNVAQDRQQTKRGTVELPEVRAERRILHSHPETRRQYKMCPEQDYEELVFMFDQREFMILELHEDPMCTDRVERFKGWCKCPWKDTCTWEWKDQKKEWKSGSAKRSQNVPVTLDERRTNPVEKILLWRDIVDANVDPAFLYRETAENPCPIATDSRKLSKEDTKKYMQCIQSTVQNIEKKDERLHCAYCDMKNHPRVSCNHFYKHQNPTSKHSCTLRMGSHPPSLGSRAQVNHGIAKPNWARRETKVTFDQHQTPDLDGILIPPLPSPADQPPVPMETSEQSAPQESPPEETTIMRSSSCNAWPTSKQFASNFEYAITANSLPHCSRRPRIH